MSTIPHREHFQKGFLKLPQELQQELFYLSLYEPSSWEDEILFDYPPEKEIRESILDILKRKEFGKLANFFKGASTTELERKIQSFFYPGIAINYIFKILLDQNQINCHIESDGYQFDVKILKEGVTCLCIGIKRFMTGANVYDEYKKHIGKISDYKGNHDHLFLLFYPLGKTESHERMKKAVRGYQYILKDLFELQYGDKYNFEFYCRVFAVPKEIEKGSNLSDVKEACLSII